ARWAQKKELPHASAPMSPSTDAWWRHVRQLLVHRVRLSEPEPAECADPEHALQSLYDTLVLRMKPATDSNTRTAGPVTNGPARRRTAYETIPFVIDNQEHRLGEVLNDLLARSTGTPLDIASAYFSISGYRLVKDGLHQLGAFR